MLNRINDIICNKNHFTSSSIARFSRELTLLTLPVNCSTDDNLDATDSFKDLYKKFIAFAEETFFY